MARAYAPGTGTDPRSAARADLARVASIVVSPRKSAIIMGFPDPRRPRAGRKALAGGVPRARRYSGGCAANLAINLAVKRTVTHGGA